MALAAIEMMARGKRCNDPTDAASEHDKMHAAWKRSQAIKSAVSIQENFAEQFGHLTEFAEFLNHVDAFVAKHS